MLEEQTTQNEKLTEEEFKAMHDRLKEYFANEYALDKDDYAIRKQK